ncbi:MAG: hypothetical protein IPM21_06895 [Acidobacteria bacterium]|nr:hypothetical protein [Acidobacteriota bacterium]
MSNNSEIGGNGIDGAGSYLRERAAIYRLEPGHSSRQVSFAEFMEYDRVRSALKRAVESNVAPEYLKEEIRRSIKR